MPEKCILLDDISGHKKPVAKWIPLRLMKSYMYVDECLGRGSLLVELTDAEARETDPYFAVPLNYKDYFDDSVKLYCKPKQVIQLNDEQFNLLLGVNRHFNRYKALSKLHWVEEMKVECHVNVTTPIIPHSVRGIIRYIGPLPGEKGTKFGIELLVSW